MDEAAYRTAAETLSTARVEAAKRLAAKAVAQIPELAAQVDAYLAKFGDRCLEELKLESPTLEDDPLSLLRAIGHAAQRSRQAPPGSEGPGQRRADPQHARAADRE